MCYYFYMTERHPNFDVLLKHPEKVEKRYPELHTEDFEDRLCDLAEELFIKQNELGTGKSADVFRDDQKNAGFCYKVVDRQGFLDHDTEIEMSFMEKVRDIDDSVFVPEPIASIKARGVDKGDGKRGSRQVLVMDEVYGNTIAYVCTHREKLPENYDHDRFFSLLNNFISNINKNGIYHRDLHAGNVMIDNETGNPAVIDFGRSFERVLVDDNPYKPEEMYIKDEITGRREKTIVTFKSDESWVRDLEKMMRGVKSLTD